MPSGVALLVLLLLAAAAVTAWTIATAYFVAYRRGLRVRAQRRLNGGADRGPLRHFSDKELTWLPRHAVKTPKSWPEAVQLQRAATGRASTYAALADDRARWWTLIGELFVLFGGAVAGAGVAIVVGDDGDAALSLRTVPPVATLCVVIGFVFGAAGYLFRRARAPYWTAVADAYDSVRQRGLNRRTQRSRLPRSRALGEKAPRIARPLPAAILARRDGGDRRALDAIPRSRSGGRRPGSVERAVGPVTDPTSDSLMLRRRFAKRLLALLRLDKRRG